MAGRQLAQPVGLRHSSAWYTPAIESSRVPSGKGVRMARRTSSWLKSVQPHIAFLVGAAE